MKTAIPKLKELGFSDEAINHIINQNRNCPDGWVVLNS
jgi:predicted metal-dependent phosphotriesterase family hydrolase